LNVRFPYKGIYQVKIQHGMRTEQLPGILDVGILIRRHKEQE
jgi:gliding motility-associated lipoprotein GldH